MLLRSKYHEIYGIHNHEVPLDDLPYPFAAKHALEDRGKTRPSLKRMEVFISERISHHTGLTLQEFRKLPRHEVEYIIELCEKQNKLEDTQASNLQSSVDSIARAAGKAAKSNPAQQIYLPPSAKR